MLVKHDANRKLRFDFLALTASCWLLLLIALLLLLLLHLMSLRLQNIA
jgi:hypothetical protein